MVRGARNADVVVVGAGFAGLSTALALREADCEVVVLEARDRVGGRALTRFLPDGTQLDLGGQWVAPNQLRVLELIERYGLRMYETPTEGRAVIEYDGQRLTSAPEEAQTVFARLDLLSNELTLDSPWSHARAGEWDRQTLASWLEDQAPSEAAARYVGRVIGGGLLASDAGDVSLLEALFYVASGHGVDSLIGYEGGAQTYRIAGGAQRIVEGMAEELGTEVIRFGEPVRRIDHGGSGAVADTDRASYYGDRVVVALPPVLSGRIDYRPALPALHDGLTQRMPAGSALKVHAVYPEAFWRQDGLSGISTSDSGVITETVDNTPPGSPRAVLTSFIYGAAARDLQRRSEPERRRMVLDRLAELFGETAREVEEFIEFDWSAEPWTRGCFSGHLTPGSWTGYGPVLREPLGALYWAGTETAVRWNGYFDGAIESGQRAATEILEANQRRAS